MAQSGIDSKTMGMALAAFDRASIGFSVARIDTEIIVRGGLPEIVKIYLATKTVEGCSSQTLYNYKKCLEKFFGVVQMSVEEVMPNIIRSYLYTYQANTGIGNRSLDKIRCMIASFFCWAADEGYIEKNPMRTIKPIRSEKKQRKHLTREELEQMRRTCKTTQERAIVDVLYSTGCRVSELCSLKIDDINFSQRSAQVFGKGKKFRTVILNASAILSVKAYLAERHDDSPYLIVSQRSPHNGMSRNGVGLIVKKISDRAGIKGVSPHILRHTMATLAMQSGMDIQNIQRSLGHEQIGTTMIYAEIDDTEVVSQHTRYVI